MFGYQEGNPAAKHVESWKLACLIFRVLPIHISINSNLEITKTL